jgi:hypothetical protein
MTAIQPAPDGPTRYRTPEESGMKMDRHTTQTSTALLRHANGVNAPETKSLCCAAAGITASISATAEALIPHEKLRQAATPNATLNAWDRPPAQPIEGYTHPDISPASKCSAATFFAGSNAKHPKGSIDGRSTIEVMEIASIRQTVEWAKTSRDGIQYDRLIAIDTEVCSSTYGLCESNWKPFSMKEVA